MAYFTFEATTPQAREMKELTYALARAKSSAQRIADQSANMAEADMRAQFGVPTSLTKAQFDAVINNVLAALADASVTAVMNQVGFTA